MKKCKIKYLISAIMLLVLFLTPRAQDLALRENDEVMGLVPNFITPDPFVTNGTGDITFGFYNQESTPYSLPSSGSEARLEITLNDATLVDTSNISNSISGSAASYFTWSLDFFGGIVGTQNQEIPGDFEGEVTLSVNVGSTPTSSSVFLVRLLTPISDNNTGNENLNAFRFEIIEEPSPCFKPGITTGNGQNSDTGITVLERARNLGGTWVSDKKNGALVLESNSKGLIITRMDNPEGIVNPELGMLVYDTDDHCLKMYTGTWSCIEQTCVDN